MEGAPKSPKGKDPVGYGEFIVKVWFVENSKAPDDHSAEVQIDAPPNLPLPFFIVGCEHLMKLVAMRSSAGFEKALELLVEGANDAKGNWLKRGWTDKDVLGPDEK